MPGPLLVMVVDLALAIIVVELAVILWMSRSGGRHGLPKTLLPTSVSGLGLLLALRAAVVDAHPFVVLAALTLGGLAHVADLVARSRRDLPASADKPPVEKAAPMRS